MELNKRILQSIKIAERAAIKELAEIIKNESENFTPVWRGNLRDANKVEIKTESGLVSAYLINKTHYAQYHYTKPETREPLRHLFKGNNLPSDLTRIKAKTRKRAKRGRGEKYKYGRSYREGIKKGMLQKADFLEAGLGLRWFHRAADTPRIVNQAIAAYKNKFREIVF